MKKKILSLLLAVLMICALLPFGAMAADQPVYADLIMDVTSPDDFGMLKDLNGDGLPELFIVWDNGDTPFGQIFTIENGKAKKLIELAYDGPAIRETSDYADMEIVSNGDKGLVVTIVETNYDAGESGVFWNEGTVTFYQLTNGALKETDVMRYKLLMIDGTDNFYPERSTITRNGRTISGDEMNAVFESIAQRALPYYPMEQVYNAATGFFQDVPRGILYRAGRLGAEKRHHQRHEQRGLLPDGGLHARSGRHIPVARCRRAEADQHAQSLQRRQALGLLL